MQSFDECLQLSKSFLSITICLSNAMMCFGGMKWYNKYIVCN